MKVRDTLLLVNDSNEERTLLREIFDDTYNVLEAENIEQGMLLLEQNQNCIAALLLDMNLPNNDSITMMANVNAKKFHHKIGIISTIDQHDAVSEAKAFDLGADDVIPTPFRPLAVQRRVKTIIDFFHQKNNLENLIQEQSEALRISHESTVDALCSIIENRSTESGMHILRIRQFTKILLNEVARSCPEYTLDETSIQLITSAAALHDIGKISIPDAILNKPGRLTSEEYETMKQHTLLGCRMLEEFHGIGADEYMRYAHNICHYHHERWDGNGYPEGLIGDDIPICAQVVGLADAYDALTTARIYKSAYSLEVANNMILNGECGLFSPKLLECFKQVRKEFADLSHKYADGATPKSDTITIPLPRPQQKEIGLDSLQAAHAKLRTLLHYMDATVAEVDLDNAVYHMLYNPHSEFTQMHSAGSFEDAMRMLSHDYLHPDDKHLITDNLDTYLQDFFSSGLRRQSRSYRIFNHVSQSYQHYEATSLRIDMGDPTRREMLALWRPQKSNRELSISQMPNLEIYEALHGILGVLRCIKDQHLTLEIAGGSFLTMLGYTEQDILTGSNNHFINLVHPDDRTKLLDEMESQLQSTNLVEQEFRMLRKDGSILWVLARGRVIVSEDGIERLYYYINDISRIRKQQDLSRIALEQLQIIMEQTSDIVFEWDVLTDTLTLPPKWKERFGYSPITQNAKTLISRASHIHPEDLPKFLAAWNQLESSTSYAEVKIRIANSSGKYLWTLVRATMQRNQQGTPLRLVGVISDIDHETRKAQALQNQAERDPLTKLLNKEIARQKAEEYLSNHDPSTQGALLIFDLDKFKEVNDRFGHMFGDVVLTRVADEIRRLFRDYDILGRIGGDEFLVLMKNVPNKEIVEDRCKRLIKELSTIHPEQLSSLGFSCSIGIAFFPDSANNYSDLFQQADSALYQVKSQGGNGYKVYSHHMKQIPALSMVSKRIDSDEQPGIADNSLLYYVFHHLNKSDNLEASINDILELLGTHINVSRIYIFENSADGRFCNNTFEWCNHGITPEIHNLQNISYETDIPDYESMFDERGIFHCVDINQLPAHLQEILRPQGIKSMLQCAIRNNGVFQGYVGFDECYTNRVWTQEQINILTFLAQTISVFLLKQRAQDNLSILAKDLQQILDAQQSLSYIINPDTHQILYMNAHTKALASDATVGSRCYESLLGLSEPCQNCPVHNLINGKEGPVLVRNTKHHVLARTEAAPIHWQSKEAYLVNCYEIPDQQSL